MPSTPVLPNQADALLLLCSGQPGPLTADRLIGILNGNESPELREETLRVLREGFEWNNWHRSPVADVCLKNNNVQLLKRICLEVDGGAHADWWLDRLCSFLHLPKAPLSTKELKGSGYLLAKWRMRYPAAFELLEFAHRLNPQHPALSDFPGNQQLDDTCPEGTVHYGMLQGLLFGWESMRNVLTHAQRVGPSLADQIADQYVDYAPDQRLLKFMREIKAPCMWAPNLPLDATPFALSPAPAELVKPLLKAYIDAGLVDIDAPVHVDHESVGGCRPLDIAIWAGASGAAVALLELGCRLDQVAVAYGNDPIRAATEQGRMSTATAITASMMRSRLGPISAARHETRRRRASAAIP